MTHCSRSKRQKKLHSVRLPCRLFNTVGLFSEGMWRNPDKNEVLMRWTNLHEQIILFSCASKVMSEGLIHSPVISHRQVKEVRTCAGSFKFQVALLISSTTDFCDVWHINSSVMTRLWRILHKRKGNGNALCHD